VPEVKTIEPLELYNPPSDVSIEMFPDAKPRPSSGSSSSKELPEDNVIDPPIRSESPADKRISPPSE
jgi:hypothetical protein